MSYEVRLRRTAQEGLDALPGRDYDRVAETISTLGGNPRPPRVKKLADSGLWRIRIGQYRIVYAIDDKAQLVTIARIARRKEDTYSPMLLIASLPLLLAHHHLLGESVLVPNIVRPKAFSYLGARGQSLL